MCVKHVPNTYVSALLFVVRWFLGMNGRDVVCSAAGRAVIISTVHFVRLLIGALISIGPILGVYSLVALLFLHICDDRVNRHAKVEIFK
jgi:hypothetical protein